MHIQNYSAVRSVRKSQNGMVISLRTIYSWLVLAVDTLFFIRYSYGPDLPTSSGRISTTTKYTRCKYHGNCPIGTVCEEDGMCLPDYFGAVKNSTDLEQHLRFGACVNACLKELRVDERHLCGSVPVVKSTHSALNGHGCVLRYERKREKAVPSDVEEWMKGRFRRVLRVDPIQYGKQWMALCDEPCETDRYCPTGTHCVGRTESSAPPEITSAPFLGRR
jgi:hypothetical protein